MSLAIRRAVITEIRDALDGVPVNTTRPSALVVPSGWLRAPSSVSGREPSMTYSREGSLYLDLWERSEGDLDDLYEKLAFMSGHVASYGSAYRIIYEEASWTVMREADTRWHGTLLWRVRYQDGRVVMPT